ncbi:hypothetical protein PC129_g19474 [Phytophthora cactorum]|uniref:Uncharacterized protein n=2 Tax=Phytophthora cactorum TaxID=29920 RepID=A0A8T1BD51_9STRA|nr:hypothetical protein Pcac1_g10384 [Phytophthora cactorum]KAG2879392.1 hypothetical protein PC114_g22582 [Phytophthora cactorum]KAG2899235.1 hypothetical protein PC117_g22322 [Phytophthora cactorum]KAG2976849.1 hypothetical protein PC119_g22066 [Phytophthora cactorum]KAG3132565.1 hypothetical protein C6341_g22857 [Phytophthora cactorum]
MGLVVMDRYLARKAMSKPKLSHIAFLKRLHLELFQLDEPDWDTVRRTQGLQGTPTKRRATTGAVDHTPVLNEEMRKGNRRAAQKDGKERVKVCSVIKEKISGGDIAPVACWMGLEKASRPGSSSATRSSMFTTASLGHASRSGIVAGATARCGLWETASGAYERDFGTVEGALTALSHTVARASLIACSDDITAAVVSCSS